MSTQVAVTAKAIGAFYIHLSAEQDKQDSETGGQRGGTPQCPNYVVCPFINGTPS